MNDFSLKNRIAFHYIITTGVLILVVFLVIYGIVRVSIYSRINTTIKSEITECLKEIRIKNDKIFLIDPGEWRQREHNILDANPVFIEFIYKDHTIIEKSPNLKKLSLTLNKDKPHHQLFDTKLAAITIRQVQVPLYQKQKLLGYILIAMSLEDPIKVIDNLFFTLASTYPLILIVLFIIARWIAGRSIKPINTIIEASNTITQENLKGRIPLPGNNNELYILATTINNLLDRLENAIEREKQFTSDASHELRTPLAIIKGTLEVLIRKPRDMQEYQQKINFCINEVDRINTLADQLLMLTRFENQKLSLKPEKINLAEMITAILNRFKAKAEDKKLTIHTEFSKDSCVITDSYFMMIVVENILSNAVKYSRNNGQIHIKLHKNAASSTILCITDNGIGIATHEITKVFDPFYRTSASAEFTEIKGTGLGLSIVKRLCDILAIEIKITSTENEGTEIQLML
jgi:signal transduction histidine kinase